MNREASMDIADSPELVRLVEQVASTNARLVLRRGSEPVAAVVPLRRRRIGWRPTAVQVAATLSAIGSWAEVDTETLKRELKEARSDHRPPVEL